MFVSYKNSYEKTIENFKSSVKGLSQKESEIRLKKYGFNKLEEGRRVFIAVIFARQFVNPLVFILLVALAVKIYSGHHVDSTVLAVTIFLMASIGFFQEMKAEKAIEALKKLASHKSKVFRDQQIQSVNSENLVPGDVIFLEMGDKVTADARLIDVKNLKADESMLTGESVSVHKHIEPILNDCTLADRVNMVFAGTVIQYGKGLAIVTETGMNTEIGKIAESLKTIKPEQTPLQKNIHSIGVKVVIIILFVLGLFCIVSLYKGLNLQEIFFLGVSAAVSAIPESLPAAFTITLAAGMIHMAKKNAIIRKLIAVENLGSTTVVCSDKTGTLTVNKMTLIEVLTAEHLAIFSEEKGLWNRHSLAYQTIQAGALCNDAVFSQNDGHEELIGDPTDVAIMQAAIDIGLDRAWIETSFERVQEIPFSSEALFMATLLKHQGETQAYIKGAPEKVLSLCIKIHTKDGIKDLLPDHLRVLEKNMQRMSLKALRLIAVAYCPIKNRLEKFDENSFKQDLIFLGILGLMDPPREEVKHSISQCRKAGIRVIMITGDSPLTAKSIAKMIGIESDSVITGFELKSMSDEVLYKRIKQTSIFARIEPMQKLRIVQSLKMHGHIIAMTGDGINDAPALEEANIGVAMGLKGTDVAKEVSDMIITDDHFDSIIEAIEEGRAVFHRLRNITAFLITTCFGELFGLILNVFFIGIAPMTPIQILWINLVTGALISIPLGFEPKTGLEMTIPPRDPRSKLLYKGMLYRIGYLAFLLGLGSYFMFLAFHTERNLQHARTMVLTSIVIFEWLLAFQMRTDQLSLRKIKLFENKWLLLAILFSLTLHISIINITSLNPFFQTENLSIKDWTIAALPGLVIFTLESLRKEFFPNLFSFEDGLSKKNEVF